MNTTTNILFLLVPERFVGVLLLFMLVGGGLALIVGARRLGKTLVISAIAFPLISVIASALFDEFFAALPEWMIIPFAFVIMAILYVSIGWLIIKGIFGQKAVDHAKGELLADGVRKGVGLLFSKAGILIVFGILTVAYFNFSRQ